MLIEATSSIIEQKPIKTPIVDGENYIVVLSPHLSLLEKRMNGMLEKLNQDKLDLKDYIEDISHQFRTPLTSQLLEIEMLLEFMEEDEKKQLVQQIYHQNLKMKNLIEALLQLEKVESYSIEYLKEHGSYSYQSDLPEENDLRYNQDDYKKMKYSINGEEKSFDELQTCFGYTCGQILTNEIMYYIEDDDSIFPIYLKEGRKPKNKNEITIKESELKE